MSWFPDPQPPPERGPMAPGADIPPESPYHVSPGPVRQRGRLTSWIIAALVAAFGALKYAVILLKILPFGATILSLLLSFGLYAVFFGPWFAAGLVAMILVHEMGHVVEIRRQGMQATAPLFVPFFGAAIFQRTHPTDALKQAQIGIAGPLAGTVGATAAFVAYGATGFQPLLLWAYLGFYINLLNLIPAGMLDGGWIMAAVSKWFQVFGLAVIGVLVFVTRTFSPILLIFVLFGLPMVFERFRHASSPYYSSVPITARWAMAGAWLALVVYLGFAIVNATGLLPQLGASGL
ncbi:MAG: site-2 protease family protein [Candidatus Dormibacterales bacterium]